MASIWGASCSPPSICTQRAFHTNSPSWDAARVPPEHSQCHIHPINESKITISKRVERSSGPVCVTLTGKEDILDVCTWVLHLRVFRPWVSSLLLVNHCCAFLSQAGRPARFCAVCLQLPFFLLVTDFILWTLHRVPLLPRELLFSL